MSGANSPRFAAFLLAASFAVTAFRPAGAETLNIPVESHIRPIQTSVLFSQMFGNFFPGSDGTTYVQTGDIPAMWLRDSAAQTRGDADNRDDPAVRSNTMRPAATIRALSTFPPTTRTIRIAG